MKQKKSTSWRMKSKILNEFILRSGRCVVLYLLSRWITRLTGFRYYAIAVHWCEYKFSWCSRFVRLVIRRASRVQFSRNLLILITVLMEFDTSQCCYCNNIFRYKWLLCIFSVRLLWMKGCYCISVANVW